MLGVTLSKNARARALQLPAWNEALGLPRPWDQQWSLRLQQVLAFESDLLEYGDIFDGSHVIEAKVAELVAGATDAGHLSRCHLDDPAGIFHREVLPVIAPDQVEEVLAVAAKASNPEAGKRKLAGHGDEWIPGLLLGAARVGTTMPVAEYDDKYKGQNSPVHTSFYGTCGHDDQMKGLQSQAKLSKKIASSTILQYFKLCLPPTS